MSLTLRALLIVGSILAFLFILRKIRKCQLEISDSIFWFFFAGMLIVVAVFPQLVIYPSEWIGIDSPANLLFLAIIFIVLIKQFAMTIQNGNLKSKICALAQSEALDAKQCCANEASKEREG